MKKEILRNIIKDLELLTSHITDLLEDESVEEETKNEKANTKDIKLEDVRAVLAKLSQYGKTADVKELIVKYGGNKLSEIDESKYENLLKDAEEIKID